MLQMITSVIQNRNCMVQLINYMVIENGIYRCTIGGYALSPSYLIRDTPHKKHHTPSSISGCTPVGSNEKMRICIEQISENFRQ